MQRLLSNRSSLLIFQVIPVQVTKQFVDSVGEDLVILRPEVVSVKKILVPEIL